MSKTTDLIKPDVSLLAKLLLKDENLSIIQQQTTKAT